MIKISCLAAVVLFLSSHAFCQNTQILEEGKLTTINAVEFGYRIVDESSKAAGKEEFARYKIVVFVNNTGCNIFYRNEESYSSSSYSRPANLVATFYFRNANGKRFTSKTANLAAREWWIPVKTIEKNSDGKDETRTRRMMAGYLLKKGEHLENEQIILVPIGERPKIEVVFMDGNRE